MTHHHEVAASATEEQRMEDAAEHGSVVSPRLARRFRLASQSFGVLAAIVGIAAAPVAVYSRRIAAERPSWLDAGATIDAALGFVLGGLAVYMTADAGSGRSRIARVAAAGAALVSTFAIGAGFTGRTIWPLGDGPGAGPMSESTALSLLFIAAASWMIASERRRGWAVGMAIAAVLVSMADPRMPNAPMFVLWLLAAGILIARPLQGPLWLVTDESAAGEFTRRLLAPIFAIPLLSALMEHAGLGFGGPLAQVLVLLVSVLLGAVVLREARSVWTAERERERGKLALQSELDRFRDGIDALLDYGVFLVSPTAHVISWNRGAERIHGYGKAEMLNRPFATLYTPQDVLSGRPRRDMDSAMRSGRTDLALWAPRKDGSRFWLDGSLSAVHAPDGDLVAFVATTADFTERRESLEQLSSANAELGSRVQQLEAKLDAVTRTHDEMKRAQIPVLLTEKLESVGRLAAGVAHEVKNPLNIIQSGIDYLAGRHPAPSTEAGILDEMQHAVLRATGILGGLIDFSAPRTLERTPEDVNGVVEHALSLVRHEVEHHHVQVVRAFGDGLPTASIDRRKMEQVFVNVLLNAIQAMSTGGVLTVTTYSARSQGDTVQPGSRTAAVVRPLGRVAVIEISDSGPGIPPDHLRKIFEPFFTTKPTRKGTGLGLTFTKSIIDLHGGLVTVANRKEGGVRVTIHLPTKGTVEHERQEAASAH